MSCDAWLRWEHIYPIIKPREGRKSNQNVNIWLVAWKWRLKQVCARRLFGWLCLFHKFCYSHFPSYSTHLFSWAVIMHCHKIIIWLIFHCVYDSINGCRRFIQNPPVGLYYLDIFVRKIVKISFRHRLLADKSPGDYKINVLYQNGSPHTANASNHIDYHIKHSTKDWNFNR